MSTQKVKDLLAALIASGFTGDQAARIIAADMVAAQLSDLNKTLKDLALEVRLKRY